MAYGVTLTVPTVTGSHSSFAAVIVCNGTRNDLPSGAYNGANAIDNGGGNLRAYTSSAKTTQLAVEVVRFVTGATPDVEVHVSVPTYATSSTIYIEADDVATAQPAVTDTYGRNAVWSDYQVVMHLNDLTDSTGNTTPTQTNATSGATGKLGDGYSFNGSSSRIDAVFSPVDSYNFVFQSWGEHGTTSTDGEVLISIANKDISSRQYRIIETTGGLYFSVFDGTVTNVGPATIDSGFVSYAAVSGSSTSRALYKNGNEVASDTTSVGVTGLDRLTIGTTADSTPLGFWAGIVDEARLRFTAPADVSNWLAAEYGNQNATTAYYTNDGWTDSAGGTDALLADDLESASNLSTPSIGQVHALTADDLESASNVSQPVIGQVHNLTADDLESASTLTQPAIGQVHALTADDLESASELSRPALSVSGTDALLANDLESSSELSTPAIGQVHALTATSIESAGELSSPAIGQIHVLLADDLESLATLSQPGLNRDYIPAPSIRTLTIAAESRIITPSAEIRLETISAESRTLNI